MIIGVDGTGAFLNSTYAIENRNSHVSRTISMAKQKSDGKNKILKKYIRGPSVEGNSTYYIALQVRDLIVKWKKENPQEKIFLVGHSRGGASVLIAAALIQQLNPSVFYPNDGKTRLVGRVLIDGMFLFDAVNYTIPGFNYFSDLRKIPTNVVHCYHAMRDPAAGSRSSWGNCGTIESVPKQLVSKKFYGSHAALGGTPCTGDLEPTVPQLMKTDDPREIGPVVQIDTKWKSLDPICATSAFEWMRGHLGSRGVI